MKVDNILIGGKISENLYHFTDDVNAEDVLSIIRFLACKGRGVGHLYNRSPILYSNSEAIRKSEFEFVLEHNSRELCSWLERFSRDNLIEKVGSGIRIISSTTKTEIIRGIAKKRELFYRSFCKGFVENHCSKWSEFRQGKVFLPAKSNSGKNLAFSLASEGKPLSGMKHLQYWRLSARHDHLELNPDYKTKIVDDCLAINLKDDDENILKKMHRFLEILHDKKELELSDVNNHINDDDLEVKDADTFGFEYGIYALASYFGNRRGSKFKTFLEGIKQRKDSKTVNENLGKRFLIASRSKTIYCGMTHDREFFEKIAAYLRIEFVEDKRIICRVVHEETNETVTALWEMLNGNLSNEFSFVEL